MKHIYFLTILLMFSNAVYLQNKQNRGVLLKCQYKYTWKFDTLKNVVKEDMVILEIGKNISKCYSYYTFESDSLNTTPDGRIEWKRRLKRSFEKNRAELSKVPHKRMKTYVYKNYPVSKMTVVDGISLQDFIYEDELNAQNWQFTDSTKTLLNYTCQKAECDFRGRHWTAWFAPDVPISDGPWKFGGLPGLIMEVYDRGSQYHFTIVGLQKVNEPITFTQTSKKDKKPDKTTRIDFLKATKKALMDMNGYIQMETGIDLGGGNPSKVMRYDLIERDYK